MDPQIIKVINKSNNPLPQPSTPDAAGMDVRAYLPGGDVTIPPMGRALIPTGLFMQLPSGYECQIRPRSGLALKHGITVLNTPGTIDADYRGEVGVILINLSSEPFTITSGERICQMVINECVKTSWQQVESLDKSERDAGGFGHTGRK